MKTSFKVRGKAYEAVIEKRERGEGDKHHPYHVTVSGQPGGDVSGTLQLTDSALEAAQKKGSDSDQALASACGRSITAELVIRKLKPDFSFIVDHRWV